MNKTGLEFLTAEIEKIPEASYNEQTLSLACIAAIKLFASQETASLKAEHQVEIDFMLLVRNQKLEQIIACEKALSERDQEITALKSEVEAYRYFLTRIIVQDGNVRLGIDDKAYLSEISEQAKELLNPQQPKP